MKYIANPVEVDAFQIRTVGTTNSTDGTYRLELENGEWVTATAEMCARMKPSVGDYWVIQADGYAYLNPRDVFQRKYRAA
jgi:hypothetical protein